MDNLRDDYIGNSWENQLYIENTSKLVDVKLEIPDHVETKKDVDYCAYINKENESSLICTFSNTVHGLMKTEPSEMTMIKNDAGEVLPLPYKSGDLLLDNLQVMCSNIEDENPSEVSFPDNIQESIMGGSSEATTDIASIAVESFEDLSTKSKDVYRINQLNSKNEYETSLDDRYSTINSLDLGQIRPLPTINNARNEATNDGLVIKLHQCPECHYQTFKRGHLTRHLNRHKTKKTPKVYGGSHQCDLCEFQSDFKSNVRRHKRRVHKETVHDLQRCPHCDYQAEAYCNLRHHLQLHKNLAKVLIYTCKDCDYQTIEKPNFTNHLRTHAQPHELEMLKCPECGFITRYRTSIARHMRSHKSSSEVPVHQCSQCPYKSKDISHLKRHLVRHQEPEELEMHQCGECDYRTIDKSNLKKHLTYMHKAEDKLYRCPDCEYKTSYEKNMASHALRHKNPRDLEKYKCYHCDYESIDKRYLREHLRRHDQNVKESGVWHSCVECPYKTKKKFNLIRHMRFCLVVAKGVTV